VFGISLNVPSNPGGAMQIDVSGDSIIAETSDADPKFGDFPTHAAVLPNNSRMFVASAGSLLGGVDSVASFAPAFQTTGTPAFSPVTAISLPSPSANISAASESGNTVTVTLAAPLTGALPGYAVVISSVACAAPCDASAYNGAFIISSITSTTLTYTNPTGGLPAATGGTATFPPQPVFLSSTQASAMYVANYNANSVSAINPITSFVSTTASVGVHPVALAQIPNGNKIYVANEGDNTVSSLNAANLTANVLTGFTGITPVWVTARSDSQKVYVLTQGDGKLVTIDTASDTAATPDCSATPTLCVGVGANFIFYDPHLNRLYVTNPANSMLYVFSDTGGANDTPTLLTSISFALASPACPSGPSSCLPTSVTALADGSRFYVASYQTTAAGCPDNLAGSAACVIPSLAVFDANSLTLKSTLNLLMSPQFATGQYAVAPVAACGTVPANPLALYVPGATRFRVFTTASTDSSHVYVSMCDAGAIADIITTDNNANGTGGGATGADTVTADLPTAFSNGPTQPNGNPPNQNPLFLLTGQ
jgi:YVTN family beta-propeller protein